MIQKIILGMLILSAYAQARLVDVNFSGSIKSIVGYQKLRQTNLFPHSDVPFTEQRLRLMSVATADHFRFEIANELSLMGTRENPSTLPLPNFNPRTAIDLDWQPVTSDAWNLYNRLDRAYVQFTYEPFEVRIGRQVVGIGVGKIFNAVSQVQHRPMIFIDTEYPVAVDGIAFLWNGPLSLEARFLPKLPGQDQHNFHLRAKGSKSGYDVALTTGRSEDKVFIGVETAGNLGESLVRAELVGYRWREGDYGQALVGFDRVFSRRWNLQAEFFYNGFGRARNYVLEALPHAPNPLRGQWYLGENLTYEISDRIKSSLLSILNVSDPSVLFNLTVSYSLSTNTELLLGQFLNWGSRPDSEFGGKLPIPTPGPAGLAPTYALGTPDITYLLFRGYF